MFAMLGLLAAAGSDATGAAAHARVAVLPVSTVEALSGGDREALTRRLSAAFAAGSVDVVEGAAASALAACSDDACRDRTARRHTVTHWLVTEVTGSSGSYDVHLRLHTAEDGEPVAQTVGHCGMCGSKQLADVATDRARNLGAWMGERRASAAQRGPSAEGRDQQRRALVSKREGNRKGVDSRQPARKPGPRTIAGAALVGAGTAAAVGGSVLLALDGQQMARRCSAQQRDNPSGDCQNVHRTGIFGGALLGAGAAAMIGGITLMVIERRTRRVELGLRISPKQVKLTGKF